MSAILLYVVASTLTILIVVLPQFLISQEVISRMNKACFAQNLAGYEKLRKWIVNLANQKIYIWSLFDPQVNYMEDEVYSTPKAAPAATTGRRRKWTRNANTNFAFKQISIHKKTTYISLIWTEWAQNNFKVAYTYN